MMEHVTFGLGADRLASVVRALRGLAVGLAGGLVLGAYALGIQPSSHTSLMLTASGATIGVQVLGIQPVCQPSLTWTPSGASVTSLSPSSLTGLDADSAYCQVSAEAEIALRILGAFDAKLMVPEFDNYVRTVADMLEGAPGEFAADEAQRLALGLQYAKSQFLDEASTLDTWRRIVTAVQPDVVGPRKVPSRFVRVRRPAETLTMELNPSEIYVDMLLARTLDDADPTQAQT